MNIDFPPPSNGTYNNAGSSRRLANYLEHEDLERIDKGIYTDGFFNLEENNLYKSQVIKDIDGNIGQLLKTDAKFYAIRVSPSQKELQAMGTSEAEQAEAMKRYIREVFIPAYAENFNKGLLADDIKFYGKIHFDRDSTRSKDDPGKVVNNMHCHIIVSRKDQANKKKLSPVTNHRNTKKGVIKGGFDRTNLFKAAEQGFDKLFRYSRPLAESFEYFNTMRNGSISEQLKMQEKEISGERQNILENGIAPNFKRLVASKQESNPSCITENSIKPVKQENKDKHNQSSIIPNLGLYSVLGLLTPDVSNKDEVQIPMKRKKKKPKRGFRR